MDKQELPINNPAERLYVILTRAANSPNGGSIAGTLCRSMELENNDENFIKGFSELLVLLEKTEEQIQKYCLNRKKSLYSKAIQEIRESILSSITMAYGDQARWSNVRNLNNPDWICLDSLSICIEDFEERKITFNQDYLIELINDVETWMKEIEESQLDEDVKKFFIHKLMEIKHLLEKYYYHGSSRIKREIYATMVEIGIYQENFPEDKKDKNRALVNTFLEKIFKLAGLLDPLISVVVNGSPMISQGINIVKNLLPPGS